MVSPLRLRRLNSAGAVLCEYPRSFILEFDESQHFSRPRLVSLSLYPREFKPGFPISRWKQLCRVIDAKGEEQSLLYFKLDQTASTSASPEAINAAMIRNIHRYPANCTRLPVSRAPTPELRGNALENVAIALPRR